MVKAVDAPMQNAIGVFMTSKEQKENTKMRIVGSILGTYSPLSLASGAEPSNSSDKRCSMLNKTKNAPLRGTARYT